MNKYLWLASAFLCIVSSSCTKDIEKDYAGNQVVFTARTGALDTRTQYGEPGTENEKVIQYVDWVDGDDITILMSPGSSANYAITKVTDGGSGSYSRATITAKQGSTALEWGSSDKYNFYAMYPAADPVLGTSLTTTTMTAVIPDTWTPTDETIGKLPYGYMFAKAENIANQSEEVELLFNPTFTAFCFTLKNSTGNPIKLTSLSLKSISKAMSGTYGVSTSDGTITLGSSNTNKTITVDFTSLKDGGFVVPSGTERTVTVATLPDTFNDLTVSITRYGDSDPKELPLKKSNSYLTFEAGKKHNLHISLPDYTYTFTVTDPVLSYNALTTDGTVVSKNSNNDPIPWFVEGYYATEEDARSGQNRSATCSGIADSPLGADIADVTNPSTVSTTVSPTISSSAMTLAEYINDNIKNSTFGMGSSSTNPYNLSNPAQMTSSTVVESANCYIVNGPGYFRIPLIMGNGAYNTDFINYKGNTVQTNAYLHNQGGTPTSAKVIWEDVNGLINGLTSEYDLGTSAITSTGSADDDDLVYWLNFHIDKEDIKQGNAIIAVYDNDATVMWSYHIWVTDYVPNNYTNTFSTSYTPPANLTHTSNQSPTKTYTISPYNLGWVVTSTEPKAYKHGIVYVRLRQGTRAEPVGGYAILKIERPEQVLTLSNSYLASGHNPYYQWGRKDPLFGSYDSTLESNSNTDYGLVVGMERVSISSYTNQLFISTGIFTPGKSINQWLSGRSGDLIKRLWSKESTVDYSHQTYNNQDIIKTIYDPCPAGLSVPSFNCFSNISSTLPDGLPQVRYRNGSNMDNSHLYWYGCFSTASYAMAHYAGGSLWNYAGIAAAMSIRPIVNSN